MSDFSQPGTQALNSRVLRDQGPAIELFEWRFGHAPPDEPHHVGTFLVDADGTERLVCYVHFRPRGEILLGGGACVDSRLMRTLMPAQRQAIRQQGGLYRICLEWALQHFAGSYKAVFGYCGDGLAERVDRAAGFADTGHEHLLVYWLDNCDHAERTHLIAQAHAAGPF